MSGSPRPARLLVCPDCGRERPRAAHGLCAMCLRRRTVAGTLPVVAAVVPCATCAAPMRRAQARRTHCETCRVYRGRTGHDRPVTPAARAAGGLPPLVPVPLGRPKRPAAGWQWTAVGWEPGRSYCTPGQDHGQKPLCGVCGMRQDCQELTTWRRARDRARRARERTG